MTCERCGSKAINHHLHGRDGSDAHLCDVCYWRTRVESFSEGFHLFLAERQLLRGLFPACLDEFGPGLFEAAKTEVERLRVAASEVSVKTPSEFRSLRRFESATPVPFQETDNGQWVTFDDMVELISHCLDVASGNKVMHKIAHAFEDELGVLINPEE